MASRYNKIAYNGDDGAKNTRPGLVDDQSAGDGGRCDQGGLKRRDTVFVMAGRRDAGWMARRNSKGEFEGWMIGEAMSGGCPCSFKYYIFEGADLHREPQS